ncbi:hypothetical protein ACE83Q_07290 [Dellaglioa sp. P0083]|uniref:hypothetical protein n=1 Tax=Dellaglioa kimchii TaxID=3344667 RepID=UPI0038D40E1B
MKKNVLISIGFLMVVFLGILGFKTLIQVKETQPVSWAEISQIQPTENIKLTQKYKINAGTNGLPVQAKIVVGGDAILPHKNYATPADWTIKKGSKDASNMKVIFDLKNSKVRGAKVQLNTSDAYSGGPMPATIPIKIGQIQGKLQEEYGHFKETTTIVIGDNTWYLSVILEPKVNSIHYLYYRIEDTSSVSDSTIVVDYMTKLRAAQQNPAGLMNDLGDVEAVIKTLSKTSVAS